MAYTTINFKTKKALKAAIEEGHKVSCYENKPHGTEPIVCGVVYLEGPHYPEPHRWYVKAEVKDGYIVKIK